MEFDFECLSCPFTRPYIVIAKGIGEPEVDLLEIFGLYSLYAVPEGEFREREGGRRTVLNQSHHSTSMDVSAGEPTVSTAVPE